MKRFISMLTAIVIVFSLSAFNIVSAETNELSFYPELSKTEAKEGETIRVFVKWKNNPSVDGWAQGSFWIDFDNTVLAVKLVYTSATTVEYGEENEDDPEDPYRIKFTSSEMLSSSTDIANANGSFGFVFASSYPVIQGETGTIGRVDFKVLNGAKFGETDITVRGESLKYVDLKEESSESLKTYKGEYKPVKESVYVICGNHTFGNFTETTPATCTNPNVGYRTCSTCGFKDTTPTVEALGHNYMYSTSEFGGKYYHIAHCTRQGCNVSLEPEECSLSTWTHDDDTNTHSATCSVCKEKRTVNCTQNWAITSAPTWENYGVRECDCSVCNYHYTDNTTLIPGTVDKVLITHQPTKTVYEAGETFNPAGMMVNVSYTNDGYGDTVVSDFSGVQFTEKKTAHGTYSETAKLAGKEISVNITKVSDINVDFSVSSATGNAGDTVSVSVSWNNNDKQMNGLFAYLDFDKEKLEVVSITKGKDVSTTKVYDTAIAGSVSDANKNGFAAFLLATEGAQAESGELYTVNFKIKSGVADGDIPLQLRVSDVVSALGDVNTKQTLCSDGKITVQSILYGDANGDGYIDTADATAVLKYILHEGDVNLIAADCDGRSGVDTADATAILKYIIHEGVLSGPAD